MTGQKEGVIKIERWPNLWSQSFVDLDNWSNFGCKIDNWPNSGHSLEKSFLLWKVGFELVHWANVPSGIWKFVIFRKLIYLVIHKPIVRILLFAHLNFVVHPKFWRAIFGENFLYGKPLLVEQRMKVNLYKVSLFIFTDNLTIIEVMTKAFTPP